MLVTDNGLTWKQVRRRRYSAEGATGLYLLDADTGNWRFRSELWFYKYTTGVSYNTSTQLGTGRLRYLMLAAEIHNVTHP